MKMPETRAAFLERVASIVADCGDRNRAAKTGPDDFHAAKGWADVWDQMPTGARDQVDAINSVYSDLQTLKVKARGPLRMQQAEALHRLAVWIRGYVAALRDNP